MKNPSIKSGGSVRALHWRRFSVDVLTGAATLAVAFATVSTTADALYMLLIPGVLVGIGLMLEPNVTVQPAGDGGPHPLPLAIKAKPARPGLQAIGRFDAAILDAASV